MLYFQRSVSTVSSTGFLAGLLLTFVALLSAQLAALSDDAYAEPGGGIPTDLKLSLDALGARTDPLLTMRAPGPVEASFRYELPPSAQQGPDTWLLLDLVGDVTFSVGSNGAFQLTGDMNGLVAASIDFTVDRNGGVETHALSLIGGSTRQVSDSSQAHVQFTNYAQVNGVTPGLGLLTYKVKPVHGARGSATVTLDRTASGLRVTDHTPYEVGLGLPGRPLTASPGAIVEVPYTLKTTRSARGRASDSVPKRR